jgi:hypothetical protein
MIKFHSCGMFLNWHPHGCFHFTDVIDACFQLHTLCQFSSTNFIHVVTYTHGPWIPPYFSPCKSINYFISCTLESFINIKFVLFIAFIHLINSWFHWSIWWISCLMMNFTMSSR